MPLRAHIVCIESHTRHPGGWGGGGVGYGSGQQRISLCMSSISSISAMSRLENEDLMNPRGGLPCHFLLYIKVKVNGDI